MGALSAATTTRRVFGYLHKLMPKDEQLARKVWLIYALAGSNDPSPDILGAWSTKELAEQERDRLVALDAVKPLYARYIIGIDEKPLDEPWPPNA